MLDNIKDNFIWHILALVVKPAIVAVVVSLTVAGVVSPLVVRDLCAALVLQLDSRSLNSSSVSTRLPEAKGFSSPVSPAP